MENADDRLAALAARQHRIVSRTQAVDALGPGAVYRRWRSGDLIRVGAGAFHFRGAHPDWRGLFLASLFDAGPEAGISHDAAGRLHRFPGCGDAPAELLVPRALDHECEIATVHESRRFHLIPMTEVEGIRVTTPEATVLLLAGRMRSARLAWLVDELVAGKQIQLDELHRLQRLVGGRGVPGSALLNAVLADRLPGRATPESRLEAMFLRMCDDFGLPRPEWQSPVPGLEHRPGRVDGLYGPERLIVEVDGRRWHTRVADFERDHRRDLYAAAMGYRVARITHLMLKHEAGQVAAQVRRALLGAAA